MFPSVQRGLSTINLWKDDSTTVLSRIYPCFLIMSQILLLLASLLPKPVQMCHNPLLFLLYSRNKSSIFVGGAFDMVGNAHK